MRPLVVTRGTSSKLAFCLYLQRTKKIFCDIKLNIGSTVSISLHSCVLASFSPCLDSLVRSVQNGEIGKDSAKNSSILNWSFQCPLELTLSPESTDSSTENLECEDCALKFFDFLYLGKLRIDKDHVSHVEYLSRILQIHELLLECENYRKMTETDEKMVYEEEPCATVSSASEHKADDALSSVEFHEKPVSVANDEVPHSADQDHDPVEETPPSPEHDLISQKPASVEVHDASSQANTYVHQCNSCNYFTRSHYDLLTHMLLSNHKKKICSLCMYEADSSKSLSVHILLHNDPKPFFCSFCSLRFEAKSALDAHSSKKHPYSCFLCHTLFQSDHELKSHMTAHKSEKYMCTKCGFCTTDNSELKSHILLGTEVFECTQKDCTFKTHFKCSFGEHVLKHNAQMPYLCEVCGDTFAKDEDLQHHTHGNSLTHFSCPMCHFQTANIDGLENHLAKSHPKYRCKILKVKNAAQPKKLTSTSKNFDIQNMPVVMTSSHQDVNSSTDILNFKDKMLANTIVLPISASRINKTFDKSGMEGNIESDQSTKLDNVTTQKTFCNVQQNSKVDSDAKIKEQHSLDSDLSKQFNVTNKEEVTERISATSDKQCKKDVERLPPLKKIKLELDKKRQETCVPVYILQE